MVRVFFRYDDYSRLSSSVVDTGLIELFRQHGVPCTFAVIPAVTDGSFRDPDVTHTHPLDGDKLALLGSAVADGVVDVSLHGLHHRTLHRQSPHSEFVGQSVEEQYAKIAQGKHMLEAALGSRITVFVPPWNTYDRNTLQALRQAGIAAISANRYSAVIEDDRIRYVPITIETRELRQAIAQARRVDDRDAVIGVLLHPYDFRESGDERGAMTLPEFAQELRWLVGQEDVRVVSVSQLVHDMQGLDHARFRANRPSVLEPVFLPGIARTTDVPLYLSARRASRAKLARASFTVAFFIALALAGYGISHVLADAVAPAMPVDTMVSSLRYAPVALLIVIVARAAMTGRIYFRAMAAICALSGIAAALAAF